MKGAVYMPSTSITIRMDEDLKKQVEALFDDMGLNMTTAFTLFAKTVARQRKIPFEIAAKPLPPYELETELLPAFPNDISRMSKAEFDALIQEGLDSIKAGRVIPAAQMREKWERRFGA